MTDPIQVLRETTDLGLQVWRVSDTVRPKFTAAVDALAQVENLVRAAQRFAETTDRAPIPLAPFQAIPWDDFARALAPFGDTL